MILKKRTLFTLLVFTTSLIISVSTLHAQSYTIKPIVTYFNEIIPGSRISVRYVNTSGGLSINKNGDVVFPVLLSDQSSAIMLFSNDKLEFLIKTKGLSSAPIPDDMFRHVDAPYINDNGITAFFGVLVKDNLETRIFKKKGDNIFAIAGPGNSIVGLDTTINSLCCTQSMSINNNGDVAFVANLEDGRYGLFVFTKNGINPIIVVGGNAVAPVTVEGNEILRLFGNVSEINDKGEIAFGAELSIGNSVKGLGMLFYRDGEIITIVEPGVEAPGTNGNIFNGSIIGMALNNNSDVVFRESIVNLRGNSNVPIGRQGIGIFLWHDGETKPLILTGDKIPGTEEKTFEHRSTSGFLAKNSINDFGETTIPLGTSEQNIGIFVLTKDEVFPVVFTDEILDGPIDLIQASIAAINNRGDILFEGIPNHNRYNPITRSQAGLFIAIKEE